MSASRNPFCGMLVALLFCTSATFAQAPPSSPPSAGVPPAQVIDVLTRTISWYRQLPVQQQLATEPADLTFIEENRRVADQVVQLAFDYARGQADAQEKQAGRLDQKQTPDSAQYQRLTQSAQKTDQDLQDTQNELQGTRDKLNHAVGAKRKLLDSQVAELESEVGLLQARKDVLNTLVQFVATSTSGGVGFRAQIEELARSLPQSLSRISATNSGTNAELSSAPATVAARKPQPSGIWGLASDLVHLSGKRGTLSEEITGTQELSRGYKDLRKPVIDTLRGLISQGDQIFAAADNATPQQLAQQRQQIDALTAQFKQASNTLLPLSKAIVLLDVYQKNLANWRGAVDSDVHDELRQLLLHLGVLLIIIAFIFALGEIWRRTTFRYVHDTRRRYQFLLLRRVLMWFAIILVIVLAFASQLGSAVTFAGLITAGIAVALQNVIVSVVAYFFLIGKYGIRVGDRVQIAGVTGEVVDIGLVRIHVMELGADSQPTGRIVALSNSIVFQPTAGLFKQIPGTNFIWHEMKLTLASDADYHKAKERIVDAVNEALGAYKESIEAQRLSMAKNLNTIVPSELRSKIRLHYTASGIEADIRFPVALDKSAEIDDILMRGVLAALDKEPRIKLVGAEMPTVKMGN